MGRVRQVPQLVFEAQSVKNDNRGEVMGNMRYESLGMVKTSAAGPLKELASSTLRTRVRFGHAGGKNTKTLHCRLDLPRR